LISTKTSCKLILKMPDQTQAVVVNTTPLITLSAAAGSLDVDDVDL